MTLESSTSLKDHRSNYNERTHSIRIYVRGPKQSMRKDDNLLTQRISTGKILEGGRLRRIKECGGRAANAASRRDPGGVIAGVHG